MTSSLLSTTLTNRIHSIEITVLCFGMHHFHDYCDAERSLSTVYTLHRHTLMTGPLSYKSEALLPIFDIFALCAEAIIFQGHLQLRNFSLHECHG